MVQEGGRPGRARRAPLRGLDRQGRLRDALAGGRRADRDPRGEGDTVETGSRVAVIDESAATAAAPAHVFGCADPRRGPGRGAGAGRARARRPRRASRVDDPERGRRLAGRAPDPRRRRRRAVDGARHGPGRRRSRAATPSAPSPRVRAKRSSSPSATGAAGWVSTCPSPVRRLPTASSPMEVDGAIFGELDALGRTHPRRRGDQRRDGREPRRGARPGRVRVLQRHLRRATRSSCIAG